MFGLFKKEEPTEIPVSEFKVWLEDHATLDWVAEYLDEQGNLNEKLAFEDMQVDHRHMAKHNMQSFKQLLGNLYAEFLGIETEKLSDEDKRLLALLEKMPINVRIRRAQRNGKGYNWCVIYAGSRAVYGVGLLDAIDRLIEKNPKAKAKFVDAGVIARKIDIKVKKG